MNNLIPKYPIGQQSFKQLREGGFLYVDKTRFIKRIAEGSQFYFLGRPRRFGKSLFLSTLQCFFEGRRELFQNLYIDSADWNWEAYPVLYLDLNIVKFQEEKEWTDLIEDRISKWEKTYGITPLVSTLSVRLSNVIQAAYEKTGKGVVILVDEYDKPLVNNLHDKAKFEYYRSELAALYSNFKSSAEYIRLVFLTGVSRFGKLSVFSGLNNISDISLDSRYADICGITEGELNSYFQSGIDSLSLSTGKTREEIISTLKKFYDGYHFAPDGPDIYNPFSLLNTFDKSELGNYWIQSGTPSLLLQELKRTHTDLQKLMEVEATENSISGLDLESISPVALFYQTGYLTIKDYNKRGRIFKLGIPNNEVKEGLLEYILPYYANLQQEDSRIFAYRFLRELEEGQVNCFMERLISMLAGIPYDLEFGKEHEVRNAIFILFTLIGIDVNAEVRTSDGRIDILVRTEKYIYIMELKFNKTAIEALQQIKRKEYDLPWKVDNRTVIAIGINYSTEKRRIDSWEAEQL